ncbi:MAG: glycosyltransferase family 4 protein [Burkholderiales bacterium]
MSLTSSAPIRIGISLGSTGNFQDGLGEFSMQLCSRLAARAPDLRERHGISLYFHLKEELFGVFGKDVSYLAVTRWQRWRHQQAEPFALWHKLNQLNKTRPPEGTPHQVATVHDLNFVYFKNNYSQWRDFRKLRQLLESTTHIVTISQYVRDDVLKILKWEKPLTVIYNGARDLKGSPQTPPKNWLKKDYFFHISRMTRSKNIEVILDLAKFWPEKNFVLAGPENQDTRSIRSRLEKEPLRNVQLLLSISDSEKAWLYANCEGFLFPSLTEGFGLPPIEAMHFGKPVFLSDRTCLPEIGGNYAEYFHDFSPQNMKSVISEKILPLTSKESEIKKHAANFNWDSCCEQYIKLYGKLLNNL